MIPCRLINPIVVAPTVAAVGLAFFSYGFPQAGSCVEISIPLILLVLIFTLVSDIKKMKWCGFRFYILFWHILFLWFFSIYVFVPLKKNLLDEALTVAFVNLYWSTFVEYLSLGIAFFEFMRYGIYHSTFWIFSCSININVNKVIILGYFSYLLAHLSEQVEGPDWSCCFSGSPECYYYMDLCIFFNCRWSIWLQRLQLRHTKFKHTKWRMQKTCIYHEALQDWCFQCIENSCMV